MARRLDFDIDINPAGTSLKRKQDMTDIFTEDEENNKPPSKRRISKLPLETPNLPSRYIAARDHDSPPDDGSPNDDDEDNTDENDEEDADDDEDSNSGNSKDHQLLELDLEEFLNGDMDDPRYLLSGINEDAQRVALTLEPYLRPLKQPIVVTDVDSVLYIGDGIPTTNDISWIVHSVYDNNITENIHMQVKLNGVDWQIK